jgi:hypothetical protein
MIVNVVLNVPPVEVVTVFATLMTEHETGMLSLTGAPRVTVG